MASIRDQHSENRISACAMKGVETRCYWCKIYIIIDNDFMKKN